MPVRAASRLRLAWGRDVGLAAALTVLLVAISSHLGAHHGRSAPDGAGYALVVVAGMGLAVLARFPRAVFGVVAAAVGLYIALKLAYGPILLTPLIALVGVSLCSDRASAAVA